MEAWLVVTRADGSSERHRLEGSEVTLGSSPTAGIALVTAEELLPEHVLLAPRADGCWIAVIEGAKPQAFLEGQPFTHGVVPWNSEVEVGSVRLKVTERQPSTVEESSRRVRPSVALLVLLALPLIGWLAMQEPDEGIDFDPGAPPPKLFSEVTVCPDEGTSALELARRMAEAAAFRSERYAFDAQDGVQAVGLYGQAEACYRAANLTKDAVRMERWRKALMAQLEEDYRAHQLRLERALEQKAYDEALRQVRSINRLIQHTEGTYTERLQLLERELQLSVDRSLGSES